MRKLFTIFILFSSIFSHTLAEKTLDFKLKDQFSKIHTLKNYQGKKVFLIFWATWCDYCQEELEVVNTLYDATEKNSKDVVFLTFSGEDKESLDEFIKEKNYEFPIIHDEDIFSQYSVEGYPTIYLLNENGEVIQKILGKIDVKKFVELIIDSN